VKQVLDGVVSVMKIVRKWRPGVFWKWEEMKSAKQWCFSIGKKVSSVHQWCFGIVKISSVSQQCFSIVKACLFEEKSASPVL
jgi:hypothetical protein